MKEIQPLEKISQFVKERFNEHHHNELKFHNFELVKKTLAAARLIAGHYNLSEDDRFVLYAALWLKDIGFTEDPRNHEAAGLSIILNFLQTLNLDETVDQRIQRLLGLTPSTQQPLSLIEQIFLDSSTFYFSKKSFSKMNELQRQEQSKLQFRKINKMEWLQQSINLMQDHKYYTEAAQSLMDIKKQRNAALLKSQLPEINEQQVNVLPEDILNHLSASPKKSKEFQEKGIDTLFRIALANNQRISGLADNKARILITVNAIILSAIISLLLKKLDQEPYLSFPTFTLIAVSLVTIILAILAIRPHNSIGKFRQEDLENNDVNILFYGNFYKMDLPDFRYAMLHLIKDNNLIYGALIQDMYGQGHAVGRKYDLLRIAYTIFMFGLTISIIAFVAATIIHYEFSPSISAEH
ncbi:Pycsar system effector family protein [Mucilaginibacter aquaedulcis]|uniref:Pycsar system effector family protein n=1 Tax=Mucilaginibacter aquaedulcis TaxID=1187081 RepID=UPI0025B46027|nr:Pycsar system effector family protein [Mucilaginibacter aquaedulcis]MDN3546740.1 DUF5706 domain-containing protein [Mucilaginibacter aquaedulcis]